jgi:hypothetical protein
MYSKHNNIVERHYGFDILAHEDILVSGYYTRVDTTICTDEEYKLVNGSRVELMNEGFVEGAVVCSLVSLRGDILIKRGERIAKLVIPNYLFWA